MSNLSTTLPSVTGYDYVDSSQPSDPDTGETWFDTSASSGKVWDGASWIEESAPSAGTALTLSGGSYNVSGVSPSELTFDPATQSEMVESDIVGPVTATPIDQVLADGGSVTVPTGEIWMVTISASNSEGVEIGSNAVHRSNSDNTFVAETVLTAGQTVTDRGQGAGHGIHLGGWRVDQDVSKTAVDETVPKGGSLSVPTGETWQVTIIVPNDVRMDIGNQIIQRDTATDALVTETVLTEGRTVYDQTGSGTYGIHIGGWKV